MRSKKVLILHGWGGSDYPHWQARLACRLAENYGTVSFPLIRHPHFPSLGRWRREVMEVWRDFRPDIAVCHSLANTLWFHLCDEGLIEGSLSHLFMVSPPSRNTSHDTIKSFFPAPLPASLHAESSTLVVSDDDPWIDTAEAEEIALRYGSELEILSGAGHINDESGYGEWEWIERRVAEEAGIRLNGEEV